MRGRLVLVDLSKDGHLVVDCFRLPAQEADRQASYIASEGQLRSWQHAYCQAGIVRGGEAACPSAEVTRHELVADLRGPRTYALKAKVTHLGNSLVGSPSAPSNISAFAVLPHHTRILDRVAILACTKCG